MTSYQIIRAGESRSFPSSHALLEQAHAKGDASIYIGAQAGSTFARDAHHAARAVVLIELEEECLGAHTGIDRGEEGSNVLGFARFRMGSAAPSNAKKFASIISRFIRFQPAEF